MQVNRSTYLIQRVRNVDTNAESGDIDEIREDLKSTMEPSKTREAEESDDNCTQREENNKRHTRQNSMGAQVRVRIGEECRLTAEEATARVTAWDFGTTRDIVTERKLAVGAAVVITIVIAAMVPLGHGLVGWLSIALPIVAPRCRARGGRGGGRPWTTAGHAGARATATTAAATAEEGIG
jgi:hypothetical protein